MLACSPRCRTARRRNRVVWAIAPLLAAFAAGGALASEQRNSAIVRAVKAVSASVVNIRGEKTVSAASGSASGNDVTHRANGMGTGVVIDPRGYILTNHHVVDGIKEIQITFVDKTRYVAKLVHRDLETDLALIKITPREPLHAIPIGVSSDLSPGEDVIAVGNAYGYEHTVTRGIISALHRSVQVSEAQLYDDLIQTDAPINPGNSGGPLLNIDGEMVGLNVAMRAGAQNIGFAIPVNKAMTVAAEMMAVAAGRKNWHGVVLAKDADAAKPLVVLSVDPKSPAEKAGVKPGDVVTAVGGAKTARPLDFHRAVVEMKSGDAMELALQRSDEKLTLNLTLAEPVAQRRTASSPTWEILGLELKPIPETEFKQSYPNTDYPGGLTVTAIRPQGPAAEQGIHSGDVLVGIDDRAMVSIDNVQWMLARPDFASLNPVKFYVLRGGQTLYGYLPINTAQLSSLRK